MIVCKIMPKINQSSLVPYDAEKMYKLVNDYEKYPEFVPGCIASSTIRRGEFDVFAELVISKAGISHRFTTHNQMLDNKSITMKLVKGPFQYLQGQWLFEQIDDQCCRISLQLEFEFSNPIISVAFGKIFTHLTSKMIDAFKKRAKEVY